MSHGLIINVGIFLAMVFATWGGTAHGNNKHLAGFLLIGAGWIMLGIIGVYPAH